MSRIGKKPIDIPSGVKVSVEGAEVKVEGKSTLSMPLPPLVAVEVKDGHVHVAMASDDRKASAMQRAAISSAGKGRQAFFGQKKTPPTFSSQGRGMLLTRYHPGSAAGHPNGPQSLQQGRSR